MHNKLQRKGVLISINPPYTDMILSGDKPMEFRKRILADMSSHAEGLDTLYIYETKNGGGVGKVVGEAKFRKIYPVFYCHSKYGVNLSAKEACIKDLYYQWRAKNGLSSLELQLDKHSKCPWYDIARFTEYRNHIGWTSPTFNYAICLEDVKLYSDVLDVSDFLNADGEYLVRPPQNMCYVYE